MTQERLCLCTGNLAKMSGPQSGAVLWGSKACQGTGSWAEKVRWWQRSFTRYPVNHAHSADRVTQGPLRSTREPAGRGACAQSIRGLHSGAEWTKVRFPHTVHLACCLAGVKFMKKMQLSQIQVRVGTKHCLCSSSKMSLTPHSNLFHTFCFYIEIYNTG